MNSIASNNDAESGLEAIILSGGLGTRLRSTVPGVPKSIAPVAGRPFLSYVIRYLQAQGVQKFIFALGHQHEMVIEFLEDQFSTLKKEYSIEKDPLGTGGAIRLACEKAKGENVLILNGDTLYKIALPELINCHQEKNADCTLTLKLFHNIQRYGVVELNADYSIKSFKEKKFYERGYINGGIYLLNAQRFLESTSPGVFSFEKDYLEKYARDKNIFGNIQNGYFIDIGIPEDFARAQKDLETPPLDLSIVDKDWTLFIDRDGVINHEKKEDYIMHWDDFRFYEDVHIAFPRFAAIFGTIIIITNQRGVGKGLMTEEELQDIHNRMKAAIEENGGRIDGIYYCTSTDNTHPDRKPNPGMAFRAKKDFPSLDFSRSIMIGNKGSDMRFGRNAGTYTVFLKTTNPEWPLPHADIDLSFNSLGDLAKAL